MLQLKDRKSGILILCIGFFVFGLLSTVIGVTIPNIKQEFDISNEQAGLIFVYAFQGMASPKWKFDDVLGVWPLHGLCGVWGGIACGIFGLTSFGGMGGVSFLGQLVGCVLGAAYAVVAGAIIYTLVDVLMGFRLSAEDEQRGADLAIHKIGANPEQDVRLGRV